MKVKELISYFNEKFPENLAEEWDNPGLIVGDPESLITGILCSLDCTARAIQHAKEAGANLILTHHPMIFRPLSRIREDDFIGVRIRELIRNDINYYAMHTNFDKAAMADMNAEDFGIMDPCLLQPSGIDAAGEPTGYGRIGMLAKPMTLKEYAIFIKERASLEQIRVYGDPGSVIQKAAVASGAGKSAIGNALQKGADVLITGDLDYHSAIDAVANGLAMIDAGHYGTEYKFEFYMQNLLRNDFPGLNVCIEPVKQPYTLI